MESNLSLAPGVLLRLLGDQGGTDRDFQATVPAPHPCCRKHRGRTQKGKQLQEPQAPFNHEHYIKLTKFTKDYKINGKTHVPAANEGEAQFVVCKGPAGEQELLRSVQREKELLSTAGGQ